MQFVTIRVISVSVATVACAICCSLSILAADEEAGEEGEDSSAGLPEKYAKDYLIVRSTISPDKKFAVIYPNAAMEDAADQKGTEIKNYLVRLEPLAVLKVLDVDRPYFEHRSNSGISAEWSEDSSVALITIDSKWGARRRCSGRISQWRAYTDDEHPAQSARPISSYLSEGQPSMG